MLTVMRFMLVMMAMSVSVTMAVVDQQRVMVVGFVVTIVVGLMVISVVTVVLCKCGRRTNETAD